VHSEEVCVHEANGRFSSPFFARLGGVAACLGGISYGAYGYLSDNPDMPGLLIEAVVPLLKLATWALFFGGLVGLHFWLGSRLGGGGSRLLERAGVVVGLLASVVGLLASMVDEEHGMGLWATLPQGKEQALLYTGLTVVGVATLGKDAPRLVGALVLASGILGWVSLLTDPGFSGVLVPMGSLHVALAALFCLSWVVWGGVLFRAAS
jgi:hypothetical protein